MNSDEYIIRIPKSCIKSLAKIQEPWNTKIVKAIKYLKSDPFVGEKMWGVLADSRKLKIWPYRVIYKVDEKDKLIFVTRIGHSGNIGYK